MVRLIVGLGERHSFLVSSEGVGEIRKFLKAHGFRPHAPGFDYIKTKPFLRLACYRLQGDEHYQVAALKVPRITFGQLSLYLVQALHCSEGAFRRARYGILHGRA